jgi:hypothetical protein
MSSHLIKKLSIFSPKFLQFKGALYHLVELAACMLSEYHMEVPWTVWPQVSGLTCRDHIGCYFPVHRVDWLFFI